MFNINTFLFRISSLATTLVAIVTAGLIAMPWSIALSAERTEERLLNIVLILADDLGYGDLGCYGQKVLKTPHIDQLAAEGMRFRQFYAGSTVCAPSRCVLMTGLDTGHCFIRGNSRDNLRPTDTIFPQMLNRRGYRCGLFGKWGLGHEGSDALPTDRGFHEFLGYLDQTHAHNFHPTFLIKNRERIKLQNVVPNETQHGAGVASEKKEFAPDLILENALSFMRKEKENPFFVFLSINMPHANNEAKQLGMEDVGFGPFKNEPWPNPEKGFAEMMRRLDDAVGSVSATLKELGLEENTLVLFSSDNGPHHEGGHNDLYFRSSGPLRGSKRDLLEGGIRVPLIARWKGHIDAGIESDHIAGFQDIFPTLAELIQRESEAPSGAGRGISFLPTLCPKRTKTPQKQHEYLYWSFYEGGMGQAVRFGNWKVIEQPYGSPIRVYDLEKDLGEDRDLASKMPEIRSRGIELMRQAYEPGGSQWVLEKKKK